MLPGQGKFGVVISKIPVMQSGLKVIFNENLPDYELSFVVLMMSSPFTTAAGGAGCRGYLRRDCAPRAVCERYYSLMTQYRDIHWVLWSATASIRWPLSY